MEGGSQDTLSYLTLPVLYFWKFLIFHLFFIFILYLSHQPDYRTVLWSESKGRISVEFLGLTRLVQRIFYIHILTDGKLRDYLGFSRPQSLPSKPSSSQKVNYWWGGQSIRESRGQRGVPLLFIFLIDSTRSLNIIIITVTYKRIIKRLLDPKFESRTLKSRSREKS